ncbi:Fpg/Nei family DNA glycosylase [Propioniciclava tarda]|uniref:Fpg/Nei family DNA glycosylase n=1 Tax=Propioniciclava tarda TaxID=433330 RepID=A0A4Q9KM71_PROTD|nr:DNA-formamidopyrimidine glycosylase family protein [Propioniciclava tarda]TBT94829.1 Fpg/Nei family DNA glycosylase [Propioniciclava tarda]SMO63243.1 formamidopyrimidine-DNA glycosylase [Propioniciclava tarda]
MPELPEVEGLRRFLAGELVGATVARAELAAFSALKAFAMPLSSLLGQEVERVERRGKFIGIGVDGAWLAFHLARAGWLRWYDTVPVAPARPGKGPIALRMGFDPSTGSGQAPEGLDEGAPLAEPVEASPIGFDLTEAGTQKKLAIYVVPRLEDVPGIATLGADPLASDFTVDDFGEVLGEHGRTQLKGVLRDQRIFAGIGNAYSDEILQAAGLSPFKLAGTLASEDVDRLYSAMRDELAGAIERASGLPPKELKDDKRNSMRVHGKKGQPCPTCGTTVAEVSFADSFLNYCPTCQTGGKILADRRMSKLLK